MKRIILTVIGALLVAGLAVVFFQNDANWYAITNNAGRIESGSRFGVAIGDSIGDARSHLLQSGYTQLLSPQELDQLNYPVRGAYVFNDHGWRRGVVWLYVSGERVAAIEWHYQLGAP